MPNCTSFSYVLLRLNRRLQTESTAPRIQKIIDLAVICKRKVAISGRSMVNVVDLAKELGYIKIPANTLVDLNETKNTYRTRSWW